MSDTEFEDPSTVCDAYQMRCPQCGEDESLEVLSVHWVLLVPDGTDDAEDGDETWGDDSECQCQSCQWSGTVRQAKINERQLSEAERAALAASLRDLLVEYHSDDIMDVLENLHNYPADHGAPR